MDPSYQGRVPQVPYSYNNRPRGRFRLNGKTLLIILAVIIALIIGGILLSQSGDKTGPLQQRLVARLTALEKMTAEGEKNIKSGDLREYNSRLKIQVLSDKKSITTVAKLKAPPKEIAAAEADAASFASLQDAQLNSRFDDAYRKLIAQKLDSTTALMNELYEKTRSRSLKTTLNSAYNNFKKLETQITPVTVQ